MYTNHEENAGKTKKHVPLFSDGSLIDVKTALEGFISIMKSKIEVDPPDPTIMKGFNAYVAQLLVEVFTSGFSEIFINT